MRELGRLNWTRATGGVFSGNDEYNRDSGSGGNYITAAYGPLGDADKAADAGMSVESYRKMTGSRPPDAGRW